MTRKITVAWLAGALSVWVTVALTVPAGSALAVAAGPAATRSAAATHPRLAAASSPYTLASGTTETSAGLDPNTSFCYDPSPTPTSVTDDPANPTCTPLPGETSTVNPFVVPKPYPGWAAPFSGSKWDGPQSNGQDNQETVPGWYVYDADFPGCATISGNVMADNEVGVFLNGTFLGDSTAANSFRVPLSFTTVTTSASNVVDFVVEDTSGPATGIDYSFTVTPGPCAPEFQVPALGLTKTASPGSYSGAGTTITFSFTVTNTGDAPLSGVTVADNLPGLTGLNCNNTGGPTIGNLAPGQSVTCTATYVTTSADASNGSVTNLATVTGEDTATGQTVSYNTSVTVPETGSAFTCTTPQYFLAEFTGGSGPSTTLYETVPNSFNPYSYGPAPALPYPSAYNAIGFNPTGSHANYIFGMKGNKLLQIDATGAPVGSPVAVSGLPAGNNGWVIGAFDPGGTYWITKAGGTAAYKISGAGTATPTAVKVPLTGMSFAPLDWTWTGPASAGYLWGLQGKYIYRVGPLSSSSTTAAVTRYPLPYAVASGVYGAAWTYGNGNLGFSNNATGKIYQITPTSPTFPLVASYHGPLSSTKENDGTSCLGGSTDLGTSSTGTKTASLGGPITWNVTVTNNGPDNSSGFVLDDSTKGAITGLATSTPGCTVTAKTKRVQCVEGTLDNGDPFTVTLTGTAPAGAGECATNTATVIANESDPTPGNNTATIQTCTSSAGKTWSVSPGGDISASGALQVKDTKTGTVTKCTSVKLSGTLKKGKGLPGTGVGTVSKASITGCTIGTIAVTAASQHLPWKVDALTYAPSTGTTTAELSGISLLATATGCSATLQGSTATNGYAEFTYTNSTGMLALTGTGNLRAANVSGCLGLINTGDPEQASGSLTVTPTQTITSP